MNDNSQTANADDDLKRKLVLRVVFAGLLIATLLGVLAFIDHLGKPSEEVVASGPTFTAPVPVAPRKEVSQPVKPAESPATTAEHPKEVVTAPPPPVVEAPTTLPPAADTQPAATPRPASRSASTPSARSNQPAVATPAEGTSAASSATSSSQFMPEPAKPAASAPLAAQPQETRGSSAERLPPAPPRLFSGFAVQAGVFADAQHAEELRAKLTLNGIPSTMEARVQVGPFKTREEAEVARQKLKALGVEGILLPPRGAKR
jgi:DedD protein